MLCNQCGAEMTSRFCVRCGADSSCSVCGSIPIEESNFCVMCGSSFSHRPLDESKESITNASEAVDASTDNSDQALRKKSIHDSREETNFVQPSAEEASAGNPVAASLTADSTIEGSTKSRIDSRNLGPENSRFRVHRKRLVATTSMAIVGVLVAAILLFEIDSKENLNSPGVASVERASSDEADVAIESTSTTSVTALETPVPQEVENIPAAKPGQMGSGTRTGSGCANHPRVALQEWISSHPELGLQRYVVPEATNGRATSRVTSNPAFPTDPYADVEILCTNSGWVVQVLNYVDQPINPTTYGKWLMPNVVGLSGAAANNILQNEMSTHGVSFNSYSNSCIVSATDRNSDPNKTVLRQEPAVGTIVRGDSAGGIYCF